MGERDVEVSRRKWECYSAYSEAGFAARTLGDVVVTVAREGAAELMYRCNLNTPPSVPRDFCSCSRPRLSPFQACDLRFAESGCGVGPSQGCLLGRGGAS